MRHRGRWAAILLVLAGIFIGAVIASNLNWLPFGEARVEKVAAPATMPALLPTNNPMVEVARRVTPAVVNISTTRKVRDEEGAPSSPFFDDPFFRRFFGDDFSRQFEVPRERKEQSLGSGVIVDPNGLIVTNNHVVAKADQIRILLGNKQEYKGKLVGTDPRSDIAVVRIEASNLPFIPWGDSSKLEVGEYVLAIGNPFGLNQTVTMGIISAVGRANVGIADYEDFIQTDAAINPGNSGGALVNIRGELIGINTAILTRAAMGAGNIGIGFAVPSNMARAVMENLVKSGKVVRGWLGVSIQEVNADLAKQFRLKEAKGALVGEVMKGSPAEKAGIQRGDVIIEFDQKPVDTTGHLRNMVAQTAVSRKIPVKVIRDGKPRDVEVTVAEQPKEIAERGEEGEDLSGGSSTALAGIEVHDITPDLARRLDLKEVEEGVAIIRVESGSAAEDAGLVRGDVILQINRKPVKNTREYESVVSGLKSNEPVLLLISRGGRTLFVTIAPS